ncbi:hypothetical protein ABK040_002892 [Willaertia magna]
MSSDGLNLQQKTQLLKRLLQRQDTNAYRDVDPETLEQLLVMNDNDLITSFVMVHGTEPTINSDEIIRNFKLEQNVGNTNNNDINQTNLIQEEPPILPIARRVHFSDSDVSSSDSSSTASVDPLEVRIPPPPTLNNNYNTGMVPPPPGTAGYKAPPITVPVSNTVKYDLTTELKITNLRNKLTKYSNEFKNTDRETIANLLFVNDGDVDKTFEYLKKNYEFKEDVVVKKKVYIQPLTYDKNPEKKIPEEEKKRMIEENITDKIYNILDLPDDTLYDIFECLDKNNNLQCSKICKRFNQISSSDHFWSSENNSKGKHNLIQQNELLKFNQHQNSRKFSKWSLIRLDNLFSTNIFELPSFVVKNILQTNNNASNNNINNNNSDNRLSTSSDDDLFFQENNFFKYRYAKYKKELLVDTRFKDLENRMLTESEDRKRTKCENFENSFFFQCWGCFAITAIITILIATVLIPLSMDEIIPNDLETYWWLFSWGSIGFTILPFFFLFYLVQVHIFQYFPFWTNKQTSDSFSFSHAGFPFIMFSSLFLWIPYFFLIGGLKYACFQDIPILSYIAIPGYAVMFFTYFCALPSLGNSLKESPKEVAAFYSASTFFGIMNVFVTAFFILLFAKMDGLEYTLNIPFSLIFLLGHAALFCFPIAFFVTAFIIIYISDDDFWGGLGVGLIFGGIVLLIILPFVSVLVLIGVVLDGFILTSSFPMIAAFMVGLYGSITLLVIGALIVFGIGGCFACLASLCCDD